jgi:SpoVK/Ycf46/Vps4 family AAA+-type ATPase
MAEDPVIASLQAAVAAAPDDVPLRLLLARKLLDASAVDRAMAEIGAAIQRDPSSAEAQQLMREALGQPAPEPAAPVSSTVDYNWAAAEDEVREIIPPRFVENTPEQEAPAGDAAYPVERSTVTLADVGGMADVKERLEIAFLAPMRNPELRKLFNKNLRGGLLLYGPPGCGKTFLARAVAGELGAHFLPVGISEVLDMYIGGSEHNLHEIFAAARRKTPCVLFFDEIDALGQKRSQMNSALMRTTVNQLLMELDDVQAGNDGVFVLAATNHPWDVDTALRRPGRFDRTLLVLPPDQPAREEILHYNLRERPIENIDIAELARRTDGFSGADIAHLCDSAAERALLDSARSGSVRMIGMADFDTALRQVKPSVGPWLESARAVVMFANEGGAYDELADYLRSRSML